MFVVDVDHPASGRGGGRERPPPSFSFDHLVVLSLSPSLCFDHPVVTVFLICVAVHAFLTRGSGGGAAHPSFITVGPSHEVTLNLSGDNTHSQLERSSFLLPLVPAAFPATWVTLEVFRPSRRPIPPPSPPTRVFAGVVYFRLREEWGWPTAVSMPTDTYCTCVVCVGRVHVLAVVCMCVTASGPRRPRARCALCECFGPT